MTEKAGLPLDMAVFCLQSSVILTFICVIDSNCVRFHSRSSLLAIALEGTVVLCRARAQRSGARNRNRKHIKTSTSTSTGHLRRPEHEHELAVSFVKRCTSQWPVDKARAQMISMASP